MSKRIYTFNEDYFHQINTEQKAYWLGFIAADGCIWKDKNNTHKRVQIKLNIKDYSHLKLFAETIGYTKPLSIGNKHMYGKYECGEYVFLALYSSKLFDDINKYNITPNKSLTLKSPIGIPSEFIRHFIRGYFDGDGTFNTHLTRSKKSKWFSVHLLGTENFLFFVKNNLPTDIQNICFLYNHKNNITKNLTLTFSCSKRYDLLQIFYNYFYLNSNIFLKRKEILINEFKTYCNK